MIFLVSCSREKKQFLHVITLTFGCELSKTCVKPSQSNRDIERTPLVRTVIINECEFDIWLVIIEIGLFQ